MTAIDDIRNRMQRLRAAARDQVGAGRATAGSADLNVPAVLW
jgi:hypothetical protein